MKRRGWVDDFLDAWEAVEKTVDWRTAEPFTVDALDPYYYDLVLDRVISALGSNAVQTADPKTLFAGPANIRNQLVVLLFYAKFYGINRQDRMRIAEFYHKALKSYSPKDPFTYKHTNYLYDNTEASRIARKIKWQVSTSGDARELGKLSVSLASLAYSLFTDATPSLCGEYHGPYDVSEKFGRGHRLLIRDYLKLKPTELWPHTRGYRLNSVRIYSVYKNVKITPDFYGNFVADKNMLANLVFHKVFINGRPSRSMAKVKKAREYLAKLTLQQVDQLKGMDLEQIKRKFMETELLQYKRIFELAGIKTGPTAEMIKRIKGKRLLKGFGVWGQDRVLTGKDIKYFRKIMDPRTEIYYKPRVKGL